MSNEIKLDRKTRLALELVLELAEENVIDDVFGDMARERQRQLDAIEKVRELLR